MKEHQTPHEASARSAKNHNGRISKKSTKIAKKSLNAASTSVSDDSEDSSPGSEITNENHVNVTIAKKSLNAAFTSASKDFTDLSPLSEITNENHNEDVTIAKKNLNEAFTSVSEDCVDFSPGSEKTNENRGHVTTYLLEEPSSVTILPSDIASSENITDTKGISSTDSFRFCDLEDFNFTSEETEIALNFLNNADPQYRKIMNEIVQNVISYINSNTVQDETNRSAQVLSAKNLLLFLGVFFIWFIGIVVVVYFTSEDAYYGPLPT